MKKAINRVGLSWIYDYIKSDLIVIYNQLDKITAQNHTQNNSASLNLFEVIDNKLSHIAKVFYLLNAHAGVFFINEFKATIKYITSNHQDNKNNNINLRILSNNIEYIMGYIDDIIQGYGDLPIYYVAIIDELRTIRQTTLFSQCSYIVNSVKQQNISDYHISFDDDKRQNIARVLSALNTIINNNSDNNDNSRLIDHLNILKQEFKGTQHYLLWELLASYCLVKNNYTIRSEVVSDFLIKQIITNYYNFFDTIDFEKLSKKVPCWIGTLCFCLIYSDGFNILDVKTQTKVLKILIFHSKKSIANYMAFVERMQDTDGWILVLDIASELDIALGQLEESDNKQKIEISWLIDILQKHIDSCIITGLYGPLEYYYLHSKEIKQYITSGTTVSTQNLPKIIDCITNLIQHVESTAIDKDNDEDNLEQIEPSRETETVVLPGDINLDKENISVSEINQDSKKILYKQQINDLEEITIKLKDNNQLVIKDIVDSINKISNIFKLVDFNKGIKIINLYLEKINKTNSEALISPSLRDNLVVFIKYLTEVIRSIYHDNDYNIYIKSILKLINTIDLAIIDNINNQTKHKVEVNTNNYNNQNSLIKIFFDEADGLIANLNELIGQWLIDCNNINISQSILGVLHTFKGSARIVGFTALGDLIQYTESLVKLATDNIILNNKDNIIIINNYLEQINSEIINYENEYERNKKDFENNIDNLIINYNEISLCFLEHKSDGYIEENNEEFNKHYQNTYDAEKNHSLIRLRQKVRVDKEELDSLLDSILVLSINNQLLKQNLKNHEELSLDAKVTNLLSSNHDSINFIYDKLYNYRVIPLSALKSRLQQLINNLSQELNKKIIFNLLRADGLVDSSVLEIVAPCIDHLVRNSLCHSIESSQGKLYLEVYTNNDLLNIIISDDGEGFDKHKIITKAQNAGLLNKLNINYNGNLEEISDKHILSIITYPQFTTANKESNHAGMGVGLDVINNTVNNLGGQLDLTTNGNNISFSIKIPSSLIKQKLQYIKIADMHYAIPVHLIENITSSSALSSTQAADYVNIDIYHLFDLLNSDITTKVARYVDSNNLNNILILKNNGNILAVQADQILEQKDAVIRPFNKGASYSNIANLFGTVVDDQGNIVLVLDILNLINKYSKPRQDTDSETNPDTNPVYQFTASYSNDVNNSKTSPLSTGIENTTINYGKVFSSIDTAVEKNTDNKTSIDILAVEDSSTVRHVIETYLDDRDYSVKLAVDGLDALDKLNKFTPKLIILDISMPRMNGLEFLKIIRKEKNYTDLPVIITTSRDEPAFKKLAMQLNVDIYLKKPYDKSKLLNAIDYVLEN